MPHVEEVLRSSGVEELETALAPSGYEDCCVGAEYSGELPRLVFDAEQIIRKLMDDGLTYGEAHEFFSYNIEGANMGIQTPLYVWPPEQDSDND